MSCPAEPIRVIYVAAESEFASLTATFLEQTDAQLQVEAITSAEQSLETLRTEDIDCLVSDYELPDTDGISFLETVRESHPDLPVILFTDQRTDVTDKTISTGLTDWMLKGSSTGHYFLLAQQIRQLINRNRLPPREDETRAEAVLDTSADPVVISVSGEFVYANPAAIELFEAEDITDLNGRPVSDLIPHLNPAVIEEIQAGERSITKERQQARTIDGESLVIEVTAREIAWKDQVGIVTIARDLSEQEAAERKQRRYQAAFDEAFDAMVIADDDGVFIDANQSAAELFGIPLEELIGRPIGEFAPDDYDFHEAWQQFQSSDQERGVFPLLPANGDQRKVEYAATKDLVSGEHLSVLRDITEREQYEERLKRHNEQLEEFASVVSHDLRNPLKTARGYTELARTDGNPEYFDHINTSLNRMERIIEDVLWLAREGREIGTTEAVTLRGIIEDAWEMVAEEDSAASLTIEEEVPAQIIGDYHRLCQLFENILGNAIKHAGHNVSVRIEAIENGFAIEDDGPGLDETDRERLFDRGYSTIDEGTGFGLYIVNRIVEAHDWEIRIPENAEGTRFEIIGVNEPRTEQ